MSRPAERGGDGETLLGRPVVRVNEGRLRVDAHLASILGLKDGDVLPPPEEAGEHREAGDAGEATAETPPDRSRPAIDPELLRVERPPRRRRGRYVALGLAALSVVWTVQYRQQWSRAVPAPPPPVRVARPATAVRERPPQPRLPVRVRVDGEGRPLAVAGPDPVRALAGFCAAWPHENALRPLGLSPAPPPSEGQLIGLYEDRTTRLVVRLYRDPRDGLWHLGDGRTPIRGTPSAGALPPERPIDRARVPSFELIVE